MPDLLNALLGHSTYNSFLFNVYAAGYDGAIMVNIDVFPKAAAGNGSLGALLISW